MSFFALPFPYCLLLLVHCTASGSHRSFSIPTIFVLVVCNEGWTSRSTLATGLAVWTVNWR
jgi:hypothetical protein